MLTFFRVMFTSHGNIRRKQKGLRAPPKPSSDHVVIKRLCDEWIRQAGADERAHHDNNQYPDDNDQQDRENEQDNNFRDDNNNRDDVESQ